MSIKASQKKIFFKIIGRSKLSKHELDAGLYSISDKSTNHEEPKFKTCHNEDRKENSVIKYPKFRFNILTCKENKRMNKVAASHKFRKCPQTAEKLKRKNPKFKISRDSEGICRASDLDYSSFLIRGFFSILSQSTYPDSFPSNDYYDLESNLTTLHHFCDESSKFMTEESGSNSRLKMMHNEMMFKDFA